MRSVERGLILIKIQSCHWHGLSIPGWVPISLGGINMAIIKNKNFSHARTSNLIVSDGDIIENCNLVQPNSNTSICSGISNLTFIGCNLVNCLIPVDAIAEDCLIIQKSFCSHLHLEWDLTLCVENCLHVVDIDEIWIDDILVDTTYHYEDTLL